MSVAGCSCPSAGFMVLPSGISGRVYLCVESDHVAGTDVFFIPELRGFSYRVDKVLMKQMISYSFPIWFRSGGHIEPDD